MKLSRLAYIAAAVLAAAALCAVGCSHAALKNDMAGALATQGSADGIGAFSADAVPPYSGKPSAEVNGNVPYFTGEDLTLDPREEYSELDGLGRCGPAIALIGRETMPTASRDSIGMVRPSGWQISKYDWIDGSYLYNRCHLIAFALAGENANPRNLITGTRTMNAQGMLPYEERVASYVERTGNHVLYRVTPVFGGDDLVASGVLMEAQSVEDGGAGVRFCAWCYNVEPGVAIDYATGDNRAAEPEAEAEGDEQPGSQAESEFTYILNTNTHRFHYPDCPSVSDMKEKNKRGFAGTRDEAIHLGYKPCGRCKP